MAKGKDRYLVQRGTSWSYYRMVPSSVRNLDGRAPQIRIALGTSNIHEARHKRDVHERADDDFWDALKAGIDARTARDRYEASLRLAAVMEWERRDEVSIPMMMARTIQIAETLYGGKLPPGKLPELDFENAGPLIDAAFQSVDKPKDSVSEAFKVYLEEIALAEQRNQSPGQNKQWVKRKRTAVDSFVKEVGDLVLLEITRDQARKYYNFWRRRQDAGEVGQDLAQKCMGSMRQLFEGYARHVGEPDLENPFDGLTFKKGQFDEEDTRPPFSQAWVESKFLKGDGLKGLNDEARHAFLVAIETGCRPSEIINLVPAHIRLDHPVPHIRIAPRKGRNPKTKTSIREIPLVGVALEAMRKNPEGFPRYLDKDASYSTMLNKYLRQNGLRELAPDGRECTAYSMRHLFEDRMKAAGFDSEMRRMLMGHKVDRETYGSGFTLEAKAEALGKIALPFDRSVV